MQNIFYLKTRISFNKIKRIAEKKTIRMLFFSENRFLFANDFLNDFTDKNYEISFSHDVSIFNNEDIDFDIVLLCGVLKEEEMICWILQNMPSSPFVALWTWDNHHEPIFNMRAATIADAVFPSHWFAHADIANAATLIGPHLPLCLTQWSRTFLGSMERKIFDSERSDRLYGGFFRYATAEKRQNLVKYYKDNHPDERVFVFDISKRDLYFSHSPERRLMDWASHKVSLNLPLKDDISQRLFDALACGLIPIVPPELPDLDLVVSRDDQELLPIVRMDSYSVEGIVEAHARALRLFDRDGRQGVMRRHRFACDNHGLRNRIDQFASYFRPGTSLSGAQVRFDGGIRIYLT